MEYIIFKFIHEDKAKQLFLYKVTGPDALDFILIPLSSDTVVERH